VPPGQGMKYMFLIWWRKT